MHSCRHIALALLALLVALAACDKTPSYVLSERKMAAVVVDLAKADALTDVEAENYPNDSTKQVLRMAVYKRHGITQADYDTSLVWYAHNMTALNKMYDRAIKDLDKEKKRNTKEMQKAGVGSVENTPIPISTRKVYPTRGDTADLWVNPREYAFTPGLGQGFITYEIKPDDQYREGDIYELHYKCLPMGNKFKMVMGVDYENGTIDYIARTVGADGEGIMTIQSDTARRVKRIFGSIGYNVPTSTVAYLTDLALVRTHRSDKTPSVLQTYHHVTRPGADKLSTTRTPRHIVDHIEELKASNAAKADGHYKPKEGVNKSSHQRHIMQSPNAEHMPKR